MITKTSLFSNYRFTNLTKNVLIHSEARSKLGSKQCVSEKSDTQDGAIITSCLSSLALHRWQFKMSEVFLSHLVYIDKQLLQKCRTTMKKFVKMNGINHFFFLKSISFYSHSEYLLSTNIFWGELSSFCVSENLLNWFQVCKYQLVQFFTIDWSSFFFLILSFCFPRILNLHFSLNFSFPMKGGKFGQATNTKPLNRIDSSKRDRLKT